MRCVSRRVGNIKGSEGQRTDLFAHGHDQHKGTRGLRYAQSLRELCVPLGRNKFSTNQNARRETHVQRGHCVESVFRRGPKSTENAVFSTTTPRTTRQQYMHSLRRYSRGLPGALQALAFCLSETFVLVVHPSPHD